MQNGLRKTGIKIIGDVPWSSHFCQFYQTKQDLIDLLVPYFKAGLENNEFCMWITAEPLTAEEARRAMVKAVKGFSGYLKKGQIEIVPYDEWYVKDGAFESGRVLDGWVEKLNLGLSRGFDGLRLSGNTFWLEKKDWKSFTDYEEAVNNVIGKYKMLALCTYCLDKCNATEIVDVIRNHEFALIKQEGKWELFENSRYKSTKEALAESEAKFRQLYLSMNEGVVLHELIYDNAGNAVDYIITDVNPAFEAITGIKREAAAGKKASELYGTGRPPYLDIYHRTASTGEPESFETYFAPMDRHFNISVFCPEKGKFATVFSDISERKRADQALNESKERLREQAAHLQTVLDTTPAIIWTAFDSQCRRIEGNRTAEELLRVPRGVDMSKTGRTPELLAHYRVFKDGVELASEDLPIQRVAATGKGLSDYTMEVVFDDGTVRSLLGNITPLLDSHAQPAGAVAAFVDITERKKMEERMAHLASFPELNPLIVMELDDTGSIKYLNPSTRKHFPDIEKLGCKHPFLSGLWSFFHQAPTSKNGQVVREVQCGQQYYEQVIYRVEDGRSLRLYAFDISERKRAELSLRETRDYLNNLLDYANAPIIVWDTNFCITRFNHAFEDLTGMRAERVIGRKLGILFPHEKRVESMALIQRTLSGERFESVEISIQSLSGKVHTVLWNSANVYAADGKTLVSTIAQGQDISMRKTYEDALRDREAEISAILNTAPMLMMLVDRERHVLQSNRAASGFANRATEQMLGLRAGEALRCLNSMADPRGCGSGPACLTCLTRLTIDDTFKTGKGHYQVEWKLPFDRDGKTEEITFLLYTLPIDLPEQKVLVCIQDITELKRTEEEVKALNRELTRRALELEAANRELEAFSYSVSHDLRAPLRSMDGFSQAVLDDYADKLDAQGKEYLRYIRSSSQLMARLIDDILNLSRITRAEMHLEKINLSEMAAEVAQELKRTQPERHVEFVIAPGLEAYGDRRLQKLVFENLLGNAFKFTGKRPQAKIEFGAREQNGEREYFVRDNGAGFDMNYVDKLFKPFQRLHSAQEFTGTGIGLASVQRIINRLGGRVRAEGEIDNGAAFYFTLPQN